MCAALVVVFAWFFPVRIPTTVFHSTGRWSFAAAGARAECLRGVSSVSNECFSFVVCRQVCLLCFLLVAPPLAVWSSLDSTLVGHRHFVEFFSLIVGGGEAGRGTSLRCGVGIPTCSRDANDHTRSTSPDWQGRRWAM